MTINPQSPIATRAATVDDAAQIAKLGAHVFSITFGHSVTAAQLKDFLDESYSLEATVKDIQDPHKDMVVATNAHGTIVGFALLTRGSSEPCIAHLDSTIELQRLYVATDCHGQGIGKILANQLEATARKENFKYMWLGVWEENFIAQKVYGKMGYKLVGDHVFDVGGDLQTDLIMLKELASAT